MDAEKGSSPDAMNDDTTMPSCPLYHEASELRKRAGYYPNLTDIQIAAVKNILSKVEQEHLRFNSDEEHPFLKALRFSRARRFEEEPTMQMIRSDVQWRNEDIRSNLRHQTAYDILQCDLSLIYKYFPTWVQGFDKQCRPVSWRQFGKFEIWNVLKLTSMERLINFHAWESEQMLRMMYEQSKLTGNNIETFTIVIDAAGWHLGLANGDAFTFIKGMVTTDSDHYPERLGQLIIINAPSVLSIAWRVIQGFLDEVQKGKIKIFGANRAEWLPVLLTIINEDQIPKQFGGTMPDLSPELALSSMDPPQHTAAATSSSAAASLPPPPPPSSSTSTIANTTAMITTPAKTTPPPTPSSSSKQQTSRFSTASTDTNDFQEQEQYSSIPSSSSSSLQKGSMRDTTMTTPRENTNTNTNTRASTRASEFIFSDVYDRSDQLRQSSSSSSSKISMNPNHSLSPKWSVDAGTQTEPYRTGTSSMKTITPTPTSSTSTPRRGGLGGTFNDHGSYSSRSPISIKNSPAKPLAAVSTETIPGFQASCGAGDGCVLQ